MFFTMSIKYRCNTGKFAPAANILSFLSWEKLSDDKFVVNGGQSIAPGTIKNLCVGPVHEQFANITNINP